MAFAPVTQPSLEDSHIESVAPVMVTFEARFSVALVTESDQFELSVSEPVTVNVADRKFRFPVKLVTPPETVTEALVMTIPGAKVMFELLTVTLHDDCDAQVAVTDTLTPPMLVVAAKLPEITEEVLCTVTATPLI